jgi:hypothetical protein
LNRDVNEPAKLRPGEQELGVGAGEFAKH